MKKQPGIKVPAFASEAEEAQWWHKNRNVHGKQLLAAVRSGQAKILTKAELRRRIAGSSKTPVLRIPSADLALAQKQAKQQGLTCQSYLKSLVHDTLVDRERQR